MKGNSLRTAILSAIAMCAFAGNSLLCRAALADGSIDAASFALLRLASGAALLSLLVLSEGRVRSVRLGGSFSAAAALAVYMCGFTFAYLHMTAGTGALLLFGSVQLTMMGRALQHGERPSLVQGVGMLAAFAGVLRLLWHGLAAPPLPAALSMIAAGVAWGGYTLLGRGSTSARMQTAGNFVRATGLTVPVAAVAWLASGVSIRASGALLAVLSGAFASGLGYAIWYAALPGLSRMRAAIVQLTVPILTALSGVMFLDESISSDLVIAMILVLGGVALNVLARR